MASKKAAPKTRTGRPPKGDGATSRLVSVRLTEADGAFLDAIQAQEQEQADPLGIKLSPADALRIAIRREVERREVFETPEEELKILTSATFTSFAVARCGVDGGRVGVLLLLSRDGENTPVELGSYNDREQADYVAALLEVMLRDTLNHRKEILVGDIKRAFFGADRMVRANWRELQRKKRYLESLPRRRDELE